MNRIIYLCLLLTFNFGFGQYDLKKTDYDESKICEYLDNNQVDPIEGIYKYIGDNNQYRLGIIKSEFLYVAIILHSNQRKWKVGDVKAYFEPSAVNNVYSLRWVMGDKKSTKEAVAIMKNPALIEYDLNGPTMLLKLYPEIENTGSKTEVSSQVSTGSGFFISKSGYIATNAHVVKNAKSIEINVANEVTGTNTYNAKLSLIDEINDVAILKIEDDKFIGLTSIPYSIEKSTEIGEEVFTIGYPISSIMGKNFKVSNGIINANSGIQDDVRFMQISTPIQPGNSGGPLFNDFGNVVGLTTAKLDGEVIGRSVENVNYAIKSAYLINLMNMLPDLPIDNPIESSLTLKDLPLNEKIKTLKEYICLIKVFE